MALIPTRSLPWPWAWEEVVEEQEPQNLRLVGTDTLPEELQRQDNAGGLRGHPPASGRSGALPPSRHAWWPWDTLGRLGGSVHRHPPRVRRHALCPARAACPGAPGVLLARGLPRRT